METLIKACYFKAKFEKKKKIWQEGYWSQMIAKHARGDYSHEELRIKWTVISALYDKWVGNSASYRISDHAILLHALVTKQDVCFSSSERDGGVRFKMASLVLKNPKRWDIEDVTGDMTKAVTMLEGAIEQDGKKYDWPAVIGFKLSFINENPEKWFCNEICDYLKMTVGLWPEGIYRLHPDVSQRIQRYISEQYKMRTQRDGLK